MHELTITGPCPARRMLLADGVFLIGRISTNEIPLDGEGISREHAKIEVAGAEARVVDLDSMNGTQVGGQVVRRHRLEDGDVIGVGRYRLLYRNTQGPADVTEVSDGTPAELEKPPERAVERRPLKREEREEPAQTPRDPRPALRLEPEKAPPEEKASVAPVRAGEAAGRERLRVNFKRRIAGMLLGVVALAVVLIGVGVSTLAEDLMAGEAQSRARTLAYLLAEMNAEKLSVGDVRLVTQPIAAETGVKRALVLDENGLILAPEALRGQTEPALREAQRSQQYARQITAEGALISVPIVVSGRRLGTAVVDFSVGYLQEKTAHMGKLALLLGLFLGAGALLCAGILDRICHRPFRTLASEVDLVVKQDLKGEVPQTTDKEVNQLVAALNRLIQRAGEGRQASAEPARRLAAGEEAPLRALRELAEVMSHGLLVVAEDGTLELGNESAVKFLGCAPLARGATHLLDALAGAPHLGELLALVKDSRRSPGETITETLQGEPSLDVKARSLPLDRSLYTLVVFEPVE